MKVFIHYKPRNAADAFEGTRLRKTLKGACEIVDLSWVDAPQDGVGIAHFISPSDLMLLRQQKDKDVATVVSAFYAEDDPNVALLTGDKNIHINKVARTFLNEADLVLVPDERMKTFAEHEGVTSQIRVLEPAVRMNRFSKTASEAKIFRRYFRVPNDVKIVVATGSYTDKNTVKMVKKVAESCPSLEFYFFGAKGRFDPLNLAKRAHRLSRPSNLHFKDIVQDDVYRSALMNSIAYISNDSVRPDSIAILEAFASQTQVVAFNSARPNPILVENESCYFFSYPDEMGAYLSSLNSGTAESTIDSAYAIAKAHNLVSYGRKLKAYYEELVSGENL
ncbi:MAG: glycosyltransferase [Bacilli bacterium]|nr:glycosyltransferase [Bacilli bacterium]